MNDTLDAFIDAARVQPADRIDAFSCQTLQAELDELFEQGHKFIVIDLSKTPFLDSAGMAVLVRMLKRCRQIDGDVALVWPDSEPVQRILRLTQFDRVFTMLSV